MKHITVKNKSRKKDVKVNVIPSDGKDTVPTPPDDYEANTEEDVWNDPVPEDESDLLEDLDEMFDETEDTEEPFMIKDTQSENKSLHRKHLAEELAMLDPVEMRNVIRAAKHLKKFVQCLRDDDDEFQDNIDKVWRDR